MTKCKECGSTYHVDGRQRKNNVCPLCGCNNNSLEKFDWEKYKNRRLDYEEVKVDIKHFMEPVIKNVKLKDFVNKSVERLTSWLLKLTILSGKSVTMGDVVQTWSEDKKHITYSYTIPKEDIENAIKMYSKHKNADIMLSEFFKLYNEIIEKK